jgi:hypothetical protein
MSITIALGAAMGIADVPGPGSLVGSECGHEEENGQKQNRLFHISKFKDEMDT